MEKLALVMLQIRGQAGDKRRGLIPSVYMCKKWVGWLSKGKGRLASVDSYHAEKGDGQVLPDVLIFQNNPDIEILKFEIFYF